jgi:hypothetical protein
MPVEDGGHLLHLLQLALPRHRHSSRRRSRHTDYRCGSWRWPSDSGGGRGSGSAVQVLRQLLSHSIPAVQRSDVP